jgi:hypothetical protein
LSEYILKAPEDIDNLPLTKLPATGIFSSLTVFLLSEIFSAFKNESSSVQGLCPTQFEKDFQNHSKRSGRIDSLTDRQMDGRTDKHMDGWTDRRAGGQAGRQTDRQTDR